MKTHDETSVLLLDAVNLEVYATMLRAVSADLLSTSRKALLEPRAAAVSGAVHSAIAISMLGVSQ